eukprot:TRINITY_DN13855_c0_g4_i1.p1 TRINITY_DN13855_c0_g4~~TRINITY_DN13855_c0_g4_i1.p1  ORF type:complete len:244 (+),score=55.62 TRINITY_DN13855_c0_g4_i1:343-1074(+)
MLLKRNDMFGSTWINAGELNMRRVSDSLQEIQSNYVSAEVDRGYSGVSEKEKILVTQIRGREGCRVSGSVKMFKLPGELHFFANPTDFDLFRLGLYPSEVREQIDFSHKLQSVTFGSLSDQSAMIKLFGKTGGTDFDKVAELPAEHFANSCFHYFTSVPHMFSVGKETIHKETFQYSLVSACQSHYLFGSMPRVVVAFRTTPVGISYHKEDWSLLQTFTSFSAIIGGVYTIIGLIKRMFDQFI